MSYEATISGTAYGDNGKSTDGWTEVASGGAADEGFLNLAALQPGVRAARDQSSYSEWLEVHQRRREQAAMSGGAVQQSPQRAGAAPAGRGSRQQSVTQLTITQL